MAQAGPISRSHDPGFNIMGLLLGGRGYAANYFSQQDARMRDQADQARRAEYASGILQSPEFNSAVTDDGLRKQYGLWAKFAGGDAGTAQLGNALLDKAVGNYYGRDQLEYSADLQLKVDQVKRDRDQAERAKLMEYLGGDGPQNQLMRNAAAKQMGLEVPAGYDVVPMGAGGIGYRPALGSPKWQEMYGEVSAFNNIVGGYQDLLAMSKDGTGSQGAWEATRANVMNDMRKAFELGTLDEGSLTFMEKMIPERWGDFKLNPTQWGIVGEKLKTGLKLMEGRRAGLESKWLIDPRTLPNHYASALPVPGKDIPDPPTESPLAARRALEEQRNAIPAPTKAGRYERSGDQEKGFLESLWSEPGKTGRKKGDRAGRYGSNR